METNNYIVNARQIAPMMFAVEIVTPENRVFHNNIQAHPSQINREIILKNFFNKNTRMLWALDIESVVTVEAEPATQKMAAPNPQTEQKVEEKVEEKTPEQADKPTEQPVEKHE